jgi:hypothetical protein
MAVYFRQVCATCGGQLVNVEKLKRYAHATIAPENEPHKPVVRSVRMDEMGSAKALAK